MLFHNVTYYTNFVLSWIHVNTTHLLNIMYTLVAKFMILGRLEGISHFASVNWQLPNPGLAYLQINILDFWFFLRLSWLVACLPWSICSSTLTSYVCYSALLLWAVNRGLSCWPFIRHRVYPSPFRKGAEASFFILLCTDPKWLYIWNKMFTSHICYSLINDVLVNLYVNKELD